VSSGKQSAKVSGLLTKKGETLPKGWIETELRGIVLHRKGKKPKTTSTENKKGYLPYILIDEMEGNPIRAFTNDASVPIATSNDVLIVWDGSIGKTATGLHGAIGSTIAALTPIIIPANFIEFFLKLAKSEIEQTSRGTGLQHINPKTFWPLSFPLPPLTEQKRIITKLDRIIPRINAVKGRLDEIPAIIKCFRQSVLTDAVTGKLTEKWRLSVCNAQAGEEHPRIENAEELLDRIRKKHIELYKLKKTSKPKVPTPIGENELKFEISNNWKWCRIAQISLKMSTGPFGSMLHKSDYIPNGIPVINPTNIINEKLVPSNKIMVSKETLKRLSKYTLFENDIVIARRGDLSKCGIVSKDEEGWLCGTGSFFLKLGINPIFFRLFYISDFCQTALNSDAIGTTMANLNQKVLSNISFPLPPLEEQKEIVRQVDKLFAIAYKMEKHYRNAKAKVDKLSQSVLAKAFRGELVITEAELAEKEGRDFESAEKLLERIQEEKRNMETELKKAKKVGKKKENG
jgi:type I restriction enzyme S subunit